MGLAARQNEAAQEKSHKMFGWRRCGHDCRAVNGIPAIGLKIGYNTTDL
jgi:hypothetical protein